MRSAEEIWAEIPSPGCRGLCHDQCTIVPVVDHEADAVGERLLKVGRLEVLGFNGNRCEHLTLLNRCSIYERRPLICRLFGAQPRLACEHGCQPTITDEHGDRLLREMLGIEEP